MRPEVPFLDTDGDELVPAPLSGVKTLPKIAEELKAISWGTLSGGTTFPNGSPIPANFSPISLLGILACGELPAVFQREFSPAIALPFIPQTLAQYVAREIGLDTGEIPTPAQFENWWRCILERSEVHWRFRENLTALGGAFVDALRTSNGTPTLDELQQGTPDRGIFWPFSEVVQKALHIWWEAIRGIE